VDEKEGMTYSMDCNQLSFDRPWGKRFFFEFLKLFFNNPVKVSKLKIEHRVPSNNAKNLLERFHSPILMNRKCKSFDVALEVDLQRQVVLTVLILLRELAKKFVSLGGTNYQSK